MRLAEDAKMLLMLACTKASFADDGMVAMLGSLSIYSLGCLAPNARGQVSDQFVSGHQAT